MCFLGASDGSVEDSTFDGNGLGVAVTGPAKPTLLRLTIKGGDVGMQAGDQSTPTIKEVTVSAARRAGVIYTGEAAGVIDALTCEGVPFGIVVGPQAHPQLGQTDCELAGTG